MLDNSSENIKKDTLWKIIESRDASLYRLLKEQRTYTLPL